MLCSDIDMILVILCHILILIHFVFITVIDIALHNYRCICLYRFFIYSIGLAVLIKLSSNYLETWGL